MRSCLNSLSGFGGAPGEGRDQRVDCVFNEARYIVLRVLLD
jgi:hypothetical protein